MKLKILGPLTLVFYSIVSSGQTECANEFVRIIGEREAQALDTAVSKLESLICKKYRQENIVDGYRDIFKDISSEKFRVYEFLDSDLIEELRTTFNDSGLSNALYEFDSLTTSNGTKRPYKTIDMHGKFMKALIPAHECSNPNVVEYIEAKEMTGDLILSSMAQGTLDSFSDEDFKDYFLRRILIVEFFIWYIVEP